MSTSTKQLNPRKISNALRVISIWYVLRDDLQKIIKRKNVAVTEILISFSFIHRLSFDFDIFQVIIQFL